MVDANKFCVPGSGRQLDINVVPASFLNAQGRSGTCKNCVTCVSQIGNTKANPELEKNRKFVTHLIIF